jgi:hypothetical protein
VKGSALYGVLAEFKAPDALLAAARRARTNGYTRLEAFTPFSVDGLAEAVGFKRSGIAAFVLCGGIAGGVGSYLLQWYSAVFDYSFNSGGRPFHSWPAFVPVSFELTLLGAALAAFVAFLLFNGLPRFNHPVFAAPDFDLASRDRFFLCIRASAPDFDAERARAFLRGLAAERVVDVPL